MPLDWWVRCKDVVVPVVVGDDAGRAEAWVKHLRPNPRRSLSQTR
jgi:hypothetical protein